MTTASVSITNDKLFEYVIAAILRSCGYYAGVPIHRLGGRGTSHQIDVIGIELNHLPFLYDTILIVEAKCYAPNQSVGVEVVRQVKSNVLDFEQTLPRTLSILPRNIDPVEYFTRILGNSSGEGLTVNYRGAVFTTGQYSSFAKEFAYAHGIYLFVFPPAINAKPTPYWMDDIKNALSELSEDLSLLKVYLPKVRSEYTLKKYKDLIEKLRISYDSLEPEERHYLFTLIRGILERKTELQIFWQEIMKITVADFNGYPVLALLSERISKQQTQTLISGYLEAYARRKRVMFGNRFKLINNQLVKQWSEPINNGAVQVSFGIKNREVGEIMQGRLFLPSELYELFGNEVEISIPFNQGLSLIAYNK